MRVAILHNNDRARQCGQIGELITQPAAGEPGDRID